MAVVANRASAATWVALRSRAQIKLGDSRGTRYSSTLLDDALRDSAFWLYNELGRDSSTAMVSASLMYTADAESEAMAEGYAAAPIVRVEDVSNADRPLDLLRVDYKELDRRRVADLPEVGLRSRRYAIQDRSIAIRPIPASDLALRVWYVGNPFTVTAGAGDQHPLPVAHEECLVVGAAVRLLEVDGNAPPEMIMRYRELQEDFRKHAIRDRGPVRVARTRRWR